MASEFEFILYFSLQFVGLQIEIRIRKQQPEKQKMNKNSTSKWEINNVRFKFIMMRIKQSAKHRTIVYRYVKLLFIFSYKNNNNFQTHQVEYYK